LIYRYNRLPFAPLRFEPEPQGKWQELVFHVRDFEFKTLLKNFFRIKLEYTCVIFHNLITLFFKCGTNIIPYLSNLQIIFNIFLKKFLINGKKLFWKQFKVSKKA
jgi:hypothetical protein